MTIWLYFDEDSMHRGLARALRARGVEVLTALDAGMIEREDQEHLDYATEQGYALTPAGENRDNLYPRISRIITKGKPTICKIRANSWQKESDDMLWALRDISFAACS